MKMKNFSLFLLFFLAFKATEAMKLNYPRVLLPVFSSISVNFTLEVIEKGCFKWVSSRQDLIQIRPLYDDEENECSYRAVVTAIAREKRRSTAIVLAEDLVTGDTLRCDVILDIIDKLGVLTTTRELYLEEAPETFEIWAQDSQGNAFTTLEGIEFSWAITSQHGQNIDDRRRTTNWQNVIRFLTFSESEYHEVPKALEKFEAVGKKGYMVLLEGINTGSAKVSVHLPYPEYSHVPIIEVDIMILANIILDPSDAHILVGDTVDFRILQLKQGKLQEITLNSQYYLEIEDTEYALVSHHKVTGARVGKTSVILRDRNVPNERTSNPDGEMFKSPTPKASLSVTTAHKIAINLLPHYNWITIEGEQHEIAIDLYTYDNQKIWLGSRYQVTSAFDETIFEPYKKSLNGSRISGIAAKPGTTLVQGAYEGMSAKAEMLVYEELKLSPRRVIIPLNPNNLQPQKIKYIAKGGDGSYSWSTPNPNIVHISSAGVADIQTDLLPDHQIESFDDSKSSLMKHTSVKVALARNTKIFRTSDIYFLPPVKLEIVNYNFETSLRDYVKIHVALYGMYNGTMVPFTHCDNLHFDLDYTNQIFQLDASKEKTENDLLQNNACKIIYLRGTSLGSTHLQISYKFLDRTLKDDVTLIVFDKLRLLNPTVDEVILPIGSSRHIIYSHGPQKIYNLEADLTKETKYDNEIAEVEEVTVESSQQIYVYSVLCKKVGETQLEFDIYNTLHASSFEPFVSTHTTNIYCVKPRFINLYATEKLRESCPLEGKSSLMQVGRQDENLEIEIEILDARNRRLMNISSLVVDWEFLHSDDGTLMKDAIYNLESRDESIEGIVIPGKDYLITSIQDIKTNLRVKASVSSYNSKILNHFYIKPEYPNFGIRKSKTSDYVQPTIENELNFKAVNTTLFPYDSISIFLARNNVERIPIAQGSAHYKLELSEEGIVNVENDVAHSQLVLAPYQIGNVKLALIDLCLMTEPAYLFISVVSIGSIKLQVPDRVEKLKTIEAIVTLYDSNDNIMHIDHNNLESYDLQSEVLNPALLNVFLEDQSGLNPGEIRYKITGLELGETKLTFMTGFGENLVSSDAASIQVFPPLRLYPRNSTLVAGSSIQIYSQGGPRPESNIVYTVENQNIVSMDSAFVLARKLGTSKITGKCVGINPADGRTIVFSQDTIEVHVVALEGVKIRVPLVRFKSGAVMPAAIYGTPDISPMVLGTLDSFRVIWSTNMPDVIDIFGIFSDAGVEYTDKDLISVRVKALNPGKARINANVMISGSHKLSCSVDVVVFKELELELPKRISMDTILVAPRSVVELKANLDDTVYRLDKDSTGIIRVTPEGVVKSGQTVGRDIVTASSRDQTLPISIEVKNIQYIMATLQTPFLKLKYTEERIPRGMHLLLRVAIYDNLGNEFSQSIGIDHSLKYDVSHKDMIEVQHLSNMKISIDVSREASNMLVISLRNTTGIKFAQDFVKISVGDSAHTFPNKKIFSTGDVICFESPLSLASHWRSSDERSFVVENYSGVGVALNGRYQQAKKVTVTTGDGNTSYLKYAIEIRDADKIGFLKSFDIFSGHLYLAHLVLRNHLQVDKTSNLIAKNTTRCLGLIDKVPAKFFTCRLASKHFIGTTIVEHFRIEPVFDKNIGNYACEIQLLTPVQEFIKVVQTNEVDVELEAQLPNGVSDLTVLRIVPAINVTPSAISVDQISDQGIVITGIDKILQKVEVKSSDNKIFQLVPQTRMHGSMQYKVKLLDSLPSDEQLFVQINSPMTHQSIEIPINAPNTMPTCSSLPFANSTSHLIAILSNIGFIVTTIVIGLVLIWVIFSWYPQRGRQEVPYPFFKPPPQDGKTTPNTSSHESPQSSPLMASPYPRSPYFQQRSSPIMLGGNDSPIYGDATLSPQSRINKQRFL